MAFVQMTDASSRYGGLSTLSGVASPAGTAEASTLGLPVGFGDCLILEMQAVSSAHTGITTDQMTLNKGWGVQVVAAGTTTPVLEFVGAAPAISVTGYSGGFQCHIVPDQPVLWRQAELLLAASGGLEVTGGFTVTWYVTVQQLRNLGQQA